MPPAVIVVIALLGGIFLLVSYYFIIAKSCLIRRRGRSRGRTPPDGGEGGGSWEEEFVEEGRVDHPIWYIRTVGLSPAAISAIAEYEYRKGEGLVEGSDCTVCLSEFSDGEALRILPKCGHAFHVPCIDAWLRSHTNCPLCRAAIVVPVQLPLPPPELPLPPPEQGKESNPENPTAVDCRRRLRRSVVRTVNWVWWSWRKRKGLFR